MKVKLKILLKLVVFCLIFALLYQQIESLLIGKDYPVRSNLNESFTPYPLASKLDGFYDLPQNSVDILFMGSSHIHCGINPLVIWNDWSITSYDLSADQQDFATSYYYLVEAFKTQKPKKVVVDVGTFFEQQQELSAHFSYDFMKLSVNKISAVIGRVPESSRLKMLFSLYDYHTRWSELQREDFEYVYAAPKEHRFNGYFAYLVTTPIIPQTNEYIEDTGELTDTDKYYIDKFYELCLENGSELVFIKTPTAIGNDWQPRNNAVKQYIANKNIEFIDYSFDDRMNFDWNTDFADVVHMNIYGAMKFTRILGEDIASTMTQSSISNDESERYCANYQYFTRLVKNYELTQIQDYDEYLTTILSDNNYVAFIVGSSNIALQINYRDIVSNENNQWTYLKVIENGQYIYDYVGDVECAYEGIIDNHKFTATSYTDGNFSNILIDSKEDLTPDGYGINIVLYDKFTHQVIDTRNYDIYMLQMSVG